MLTQREILCNVGDSVRVKATGKIGQITKSNGHAHKVNGVRLHEAETELDRARADSRTPKLAGTLEVSQAQIEVIQKGIAAELRKIFELPAHTPEEAYGIPLKLTPSPRVRRSKQRKRGKGEARLDEALPFVSMIALGQGKLHCRRKYAERNHSWSWQIQKRSRRKSQRHRKSSCRSCGLATSKAQLNVSFRWRSTENLRAGLRSWL